MRVTHIQREKDKSLFLDVKNGICMHGEGLMDVTSGDILHTTKHKSWYFFFCVCAILEFELSLLLVRQAFYHLSHSTSPIMVILNKMSWYLMWRRPPS
jgi:hypothetical protein